MTPLPPAAVLGLALFAATAVSCATSSLAGGLESPVPAARLHAMEAVAHGDRSPATLRRLIEQLDSDDGAVRLVAISTLARLTGETRGYRYDDPVGVRRAAIDRWVTEPLDRTSGIEHREPRSGADDHG